MLLTVAADERAALQFDDLASALDAGLSIDALGGDAAAGERTVHEILAQRRVRLSSSEDAVLAAAWAAGRISQALRGRATQRRQRAEFGRQLRAGLRYPALLLVMAVAIGLIASRLFNSYSLLLGLLLLLVLLGAGVFVVQRGLRSGSEGWLRVPWLGPLAAGLGELPYLETLHALYSSGIPILDAHASATASVTVASLRIRLRTAERVLRGGTSLAEALRTSEALLGETRSLLAAGETGGNLEDALERTLKRRREVTARDVQTTARWAGGLAYGTAAIASIYFILSFYSAYFARLGR